MPEPSDTVAVRPGEEIPAERLFAYLLTQLPDMPAGEMTIRQFPAGASNLTYLIRVGSWEAVLRRPPLGPVPPKAHDMRRESRLLEQLHPVFSLAPRPYLYCDDESVIGVPFYVMERRKGVVLDREFPEGQEAGEAVAKAISLAVVDTLTDIHAIDWGQAGLSEFGHPEGFLARQVSGWIARYQKARTDDVAGVEPLMAWILEKVPESPAPTLIHNDFKLNNMIMDAQCLARPVAVLDWEMATIGDPLFDVGVALTYWVQANDPEELKQVLPTVTDRPGFLTRRDMMERYARKSGRDLQAFHFYQTFGYFKLAVILQQIYARWYRGQTRDPRFATFSERVQHLLHHAYHMAMDPNAFLD